MIFDNCSGQNKNYTVLKLALWLMAMRYFKSIQFIFLVERHTQNAADRLFNSLKQECRKQNLFMFDQLATTLDQSALVTIHQTVANDFLDYDSLLDGIYRMLVLNITADPIHQKEGLATRALRQVTMARTSQCAVNATAMYARDAQEHTTK